MYYCPSQTPYWHLSRIVVTHDCVVPAKHEANVSMHMEDDGIPLPPGDWAIELQGLGPA